MDADTVTGMYTHTPYIYTLKYTAFIRTPECNTILRNIHALYFYMCRWPEFCLSPIVYRNRIDSTTTRKIQNCAPPPGQLMHNIHRLRYPLDAFCYYHCHASWMHWPAFSCGCTGGGGTSRHGANVSHEGMLLKYPPPK